MRIPPLTDAVRRAASAVRDADALLITAGAGMGVDSGLPDFRGGDGFWRAYPPLARLGLPFEEIANPESFQRDAPLAWGFYGHRLNLYRATVPHEGFSLLQQWADAKPMGHFVFTSNVDGQFQKADFDEERLAECHGSLHHLQCCFGCRRTIWDVPPGKVSVDETTLRADHPLPACPACGFVARPNVLMFNDGRWLPYRAEAQDERMAEWLGGVFEAKKRLVIVECGAGHAIPTVRWFGEHLVGMGATLVRINPRDFHIPRGMISLPVGALEGLRLIDSVLASGT